MNTLVLISGRGSNLQALLDRAGRGWRVGAVISNRPDAAGLARARAAAVDAAVVDHRAFDDRAAFDRALADAIDARAPDLILLAGFMRVLGDAFVERYRGRLLNIHPALLPAFKGLDTHARALAAGAAEHGASVHFVIPALDAGPLIARHAVPVLDGDDETALAARVLAVEHRLYPAVVDRFAAGRLALRDGAVWHDGTPLRTPLRLADDDTLCAA